MELEVASEFHLSQPLNNTRILRGVTAYVEVWSGNENRCECVKAQLKSLGAMLEDKFTLKVTHVLFNEGSLTTYKKAKKRNIPLLSVLWIEESKRLERRACEKTYRAIQLERYEEPDIFSSPTMKRPRRNVPNHRRFRKKKRSSEETKNESYEAYFVPEMFNENSASIKGGIIGTLKNVAGETFSTVEENDIFPCSQMSADINEPLTKKLYNRFLAEVKEDCEENSSSGHSCPSVLNSQDDSKPRENEDIEISNGGAIQKCPYVTNGNEKISYKRTQIPITFFFRAAVTPTRLPTIVFTGMHFEEVQLLTSIVNKIGGFHVEKTVGGHCNHVVCGYPPKRTINMLRGIARGCWILSKEWILKSLDSNKWLNEKEFELNYFLPAIKKVRTDREKIMPSVFRHYLFSRCGPFYIGASCSNPPASNIRELLLLCGGYVVSSPRAAKILIVGVGKSISSSMRRAKDQIYVTEKWVLDSISEDSVCPFVPPYVVDTNYKRRST